MCSKEIPWKLLDKGDLGVSMVMWAHEEDFEYLNG